MGFIVLIPLLLLLGGGIGITILATILAERQMRHAGYTLSWLVGGLLCTFAMVFSFGTWAFGGLGSDADHGAMDAFKTPLGGGFYLLSIDSDYDLPLPLAQRSDEGGVSITPQNTVTALACTDDQTFLKFKEGFGRIERESRALVHLSAVEVPTAGTSPFWLNKEAFLTTRCANVPTSSQDALRNTTALWIGPVLTLVIVISLLAWGSKIATTHDERSGSW